MSILQHLCSSQQRKERYFKRGVLHSMVLHEHPTDLNSSYAAGAHWAAQVGCNTPGQGCIDALGFSFLTHTN